MLGNNNHNINSLTDDALLYLFMTIPVHDLLTLRNVSTKAILPRWWPTDEPDAKASRRLNYISRVKQVWVHITQRDVISRNLPYALYWKDIDILDAAQLERLALHAIRLGSRIDKCRPPATVVLHRTRSVTWVRLLHSQWLLVASSDDVSSSISLWSTGSLLSGGSTEPLAEAFLPAPVSNGATEVEHSSVLIAVELCGK